jgi:hypothetical protein
MIDNEPSIADAFVMVDDAGGAAHQCLGRPSIADQRIISSSSATSSRHQICSRISMKLTGCFGGAGMPRASAEYR